MLRRTRRAPTACSWCHHRKVRCDASILGCPCTRCRQDGRDDCTLRQKLPKTQKSYSSSEFCDPQDQHSEANLIKSNNFSNLPSFVDQSDKSRSLSRPPGLSSPLVTDPSVESHDPLTRIERHPFLDIGNLKFIPAEDKVFLCSKGALEIPEASSLREFVDNYFKTVHPMLPVIDEIQFWRALCGEPGETVSLFVFQALLFVSCSFVSEQTLRRCGFADRRDARTQLYNRAKLLFDLKGEGKPFAKAQGAIILTHHTSAESPLSGSLWLTCAIQNAMIMDAQPSLIPQKVGTAMKKRLWWSILLRDRSLCIGLRRCPQVTSLNLHGCRDWLKEEDFAGEMQNSRVHDYANRKALLSALQEQCQLAILLTDLAAAIFSPRVTPASTYSSDEFRSLLNKLRNIKHSLIRWKSQSQPPPEPEGSLHTDPSGPLRNLTFMYYFTARVDLAHYLTLLIEEYPGLSRQIYLEMMAEVGSDLKNGVDGLNNVMGYFSEHGHIEELPLSVLGYVGMPLVLAAINLKLSPSREKMESRQKILASLSKIIRHSEKLYDVTDSVAAGTNHILQLAYVTTKSFFLCDGTPPEAFVGQSTEESSRGNNVSSIRRSKGSRSANIPRSTSWLDAFIRCPRAYLLISTCVDHSLSVGRLPYISSLPALVREIPAMCSMAQLPWIVQSDSLQNLSVPNSATHLLVRTSRGGGIGAGGSPDKFQSNSEHQAQEGGEPDESRGQSTNKKQGLMQTKQATYGVVNLDFLDLDTDVSEPFPPMATSPSSIYRGPCSGLVDSCLPSLPESPLVYTANTYTHSGNDLHSCYFHSMQYSALEDQCSM